MNPKSCLGRWGQVALSPSSGAPALSEVIARVLDPTRLKPFCIISHMGCDVFC